MGTTTIISGGKVYTIISLIKNAVAVGDFAWGRELGTLAHLLDPAVRHMHLQLPLRKAIEEASDDTVIAGITSVHDAAMARKVVLFSKQHSAELIQVDPDPCLAFPLLSGDQRTAWIDERGQETLAAGTQETKISVSWVAGEHLRQCKTVQRDPATWLTDFLETHGPQVGGCPWATIILPEPYRLIDHFQSVRESKFDMAGVHRAELFGASPIRLCEIRVFDPECLEAAAERSPELFGEAWAALGSKDEDEHWICLVPPLDEEWVATNCDQREYDTIITYRDGEKPGART